MSRWKVSKNSDPRFEYPWEVDGPDGELSNVFATWAEALELACMASRMRREEENRRQP